MEEIRFSIIMPAHNAEKEIEDAIKSVIMQDYENYEFIPEYIEFFICTKCF